MKKLSIYNLIVFVAFFSLVAIALKGCGGGGGGGDGGQQPAPSVFNGTFSGDITTTQGEEHFIDTMNISLTTHSPLSGTFFIRGDVGTISGNAEGDVATFTGTIDGICPGSFNGSITLISDNTFSISMTGSDCSGSFNSTGDLKRVEYIEIAGTWRVSESGTVTCVFDGKSETETISGTGTVVIEQNGRNVSYVPPSINAPRGGEIEGNTISFSGLFVVPLVGGVNFSQNIVTIKGPIIDEEEFTLYGSGIATGTFEGVGFTCTGNTTAKFKRRYDVAVAVLRGGAFPEAFKVCSDNALDCALDKIKEQAIQVDPKRVIAQGFGSGLDQWSRVERWLDEINRDLDRPVKVILIGHSLGGDAVRTSTYPNMCSRITIDPINPSLILDGILNQRNEDPLPVGWPAGRFINILASTAEDLDGVKGLFLLGHHITGATAEWVEDEPATNHFTVIPRVLSGLVVVSEVQGCLE